MLPKICIVFVTGAVVCFTERMSTCCSYRLGFSLLIWIEAQFCVRLRPAGLGPTCKSRHLEGGSDPWWPQSTLTTSEPFPPESGSSEMISPRERNTPLLVAVDFPLEGSPTAVTCIPSDLLADSPLPTCHAYVLCLTQKH